jgi:hypothetical protein
MRGTLAGVSGLVVRNTYTFRMPSTSLAVRLTRVRNNPAGQLDKQDVARGPAKFKPERNNIYGIEKFNLL